MELAINDTKSYSTVELNSIRNSIESMNKFNQIEILRILHTAGNCVINENKYGIHVNLTDVDSSTIDSLLAYIKYVTAQESNLHTVEQQKEDFKNIYFMKDNKDNS